MTSTVNLTVYSSLSLLQQSYVVCSQHLDLIIMEIGFGSFEQNTCYVCLALSVNEFLTKFTGLISYLFICQVNP